MLKGVSGAIPDFHADQRTRMMKRMNLKSRPFLNWKILSLKILSLNFHRHDCRLPHHPCACKAPRYRRSLEPGRENQWRQQYHDQ